MKIQSLNNSNNKVFSKPSEIEKENMICKDGFCSIPSESSTPRINSDDINLFDPI